jgi:phi13 family phage major tail protein
MAFIGLRNPVFAPIASEPEEAAIVYGPGVKLCDAIGANVSFKRGDSPLYSSDVIVESDNGITGGTVSFSTSDLPDEQQETMLGLSEEGTAPNAYYEETAASAKPGGFGYVRVKKKNGVVKYVGYWIHKVLFSLTADEAKTKGESIEWQTPTIDGTIMGVYIDNSGVARFRRHKEFTTWAEAKAWVYGLAGITEA